MAAAGPVQPPVQLQPSPAAAPQPQPAPSGEYTSFRCGPADLRLLQLAATSSADIELCRHAKGVDRSGRRQNLWYLVKPSGQEVHNN